MPDTTALQLRSTAVPGQASPSAPQRPQHEQEQLICHHLPGEQHGVSFPRCRELQLPVEEAYRIAALFLLLQRWIILPHKRLTDEKKVTVVIPNKFYFKAKI